MADRNIVFGPLPPPYGGVSVFMASLKNAALDHGAEVWSYAGDAGDTRVRTVDHRTFGHIRGLISGPGPSRIVDSTHFHLEYPHRLLLPAWLRLKKQKPFTWIKICHDGSLPFRYPEMNDAIKRRVSKAVSAIDKLVVTSPDLVAFFRDSFGRDARYISPLLPSERIAVVEGERRDEVFSVLSIGTFIPSYGFHEVAAAVEALRSDRPEARLTLVDANFSRDDTYRREVIKNRPWITMLEAATHDDVQRLLRSSDVFVRACAHESYGLSRVEAILAGTPVVATNIGETRGMMTYSSGDLDALIRHLRTIAMGERPDVSEVAESYRLDARNNLNEYLHLITGSSDA